MGEYASLENIRDILNFDIDEVNRGLPFSERWENLTIANDFMFGKVFQDSDLCLELVKRILPELNIERITLHEQQKAAHETIDTRGVRFDVYLHDDRGRIIIIEMQIANRKDLPQRSRFYHSSADLEAREKSKYRYYGEMPEVIVVFICEFDPFGCGRYVYTFKNVCTEERNLMLNDGASTIFLNTKGKDDISPKLKAFLDIVGGESSDDEFVRRIEHRLKYAKQNLHWRREYMLDMMEIGSIEHEAEERGITIGEERGIVIGEKRGIAIGEERGITIGEHKAKISTAMRMRQAGMNNAQISMFTGLSFEEIQNL